MGRYQILKHLASGGMAEIYLARATGIEGFERYVVVKRILGEHAQDKRFVTMFVDEARLAAQLHHQNIAQVYDCGQDDGTYYFAMEYVHGENLRELLKKMAIGRRQVPLEHALTIIAGGCAGLHYAHDKRGQDRSPLGIVHRDVSPSNLIVAYDGGIKVVDFGIAKAASRMSETRSGTLKGKIAYMSPEQCLGKALDRRSDIFALGIVMYELTTVSRLFKGENDYITMNRIVTGDIPSPTKKRPDYPPALEAILMKALALDPIDRYQTAGEMLEAIEQFATRERISLSTTALGRFIRELFGERPEPWQDLSASEPRDPSSDEVDIVEVTQSNVGGDTGVAVPAPAPAVRVPTTMSAIAGSRRRSWTWLGAVLAAAAATVVVVLALGGGARDRDERAGSGGDVAPPTPTGTAPGAASGAGSASPGSAGPSAARAQGARARAARARSTPAARARAWAARARPRRSPRRGRCHDPEGAAARRHARRASGIRTWQPEGASVRRARARGWFHGHRRRRQRELGGRREPRRGRERGLRRERGSRHTTDSGASAGSGSAAGSAATPKKRDPKVLLPPEG